MNFARSEHETSINFNDEDDFASIYTCRKGWWSQLERRGLKPYRVQEYDGEIFAKWYHVPKTWVIACPRPPRKSNMTDEQKAAATARLAAASRRACN